MIQHADSFYAEMERPRRALLYHCMQHASLAIPDVEYDDAGFIVSPSYMASMVLSRCCLCNCGWFCNNRLFSSLLSTASKSPRNFSLNKEHLEKLLLHDEDRTLQIREKYHRNTEETVGGKRDVV